MIDEKHEDREVFDSYAGWICRSCGQASGWCKLVGHPDICLIENVPKFHLDLGHEHERST